MNRKTYILASLILTALIGAAAIWNYSATTASAQESDAVENLGVVVTEYNARNEFALTQGGTTGVWNYGYSTSDTDNTFTLYPMNDTPPSCSGGQFRRWFSPTSGDFTPQIAANTAAVPCSSVPPDALFMHPGPTGRRSVLRWTAPAAGTYQITGVFGKQDPTATSDLKILKNVTEPALFAGNLNGTNGQRPFNFTVTVAAGDTLDFSVGWGNGSYNSDGSLLTVTIGQPVTACLTAPANLQVNVPAENSPSDVASLNTNAQLVGDATYTNMGKIGRAFEFDGSGDYVRIEDNAAQRPATAVTVEGWFKFDSTPGGIVSLVSKPLRNSVFNSYSLYMEGGQLRGFAAHPSQYTRVFSNFTPQSGVWHHLAFTYNFSGGVSTLKLYANGTEVTTGQDGTPNLPLYYDANPYPLLIGGEFENNAPGFFHDGQADEVSVYDRALAQAEIFDLVQQGSFGKCAPGSACLSAPNGLVSWYKGEDNALDSNSLNPAALQNGTTFSNGRVGRAFSFDGSDDFVAAPGSSSLDITGDLTIEAWVNPAQIQAGSVTLVDKRDPSNNNLNYVLFLVNGELRFASRSNGGAFNENFSGVILSAGTFSHVAVTIQNGALKFYVNGVSSPILSAPATRSAATGRLIIGATETTVLSGFFNGSIDELSIYNRALSASEILSIMTAGANGKCLTNVCAQAPNDLVSWFAGEQNALDSRSNNHGAAQNGAGFAGGKVGRAFNLDGSNDYYSTPDSPDWDFGTGDFAIEAWFNAPNPTGVQRIISAGSQADGANNLWSLGYGDIPVWGGGQRINFAVFNGGAYTDFSSNPVTLIPNTWHHAAVVRSGSSLTFYLDGAPVGTVAVGAGFVINGGSSGAIIGARYNNDPSAVFEFAGGRLDEISVYKRALSATEISSVYNAGSSGKCKPAGLNPAANLVGFWTGDGDARDFLGLNPNGILRGDANFRVGRVSQSFNFDGSGDYVEIPDNPDHRPANITIEGWFNVRSISDSHFVSKPIVGTNSNSYVVWYDGGVMRGGHGDQFSNFETLSTSFSPNLNTWYHFAYTIDDANNVHRFYINGAEIASAASVLPLFYDANPHPLLIGAEYGPPGTPYSFVDGRMDEISLYSRVLSASEIAAVYNAGAAGKVKAKTVNVTAPARTKTADLLAPATVQLSDATVTFANVTSSGTVSENGIDLGLLPPLPPSARFTGLAYDIRATVGYQQGSPDDVQVCFNVPALAALNFANLQVLHLENGVWVNRTASGNTSPNVCTDNLTSLSPFVITEALAPTAASVSVSGRVADASGAALGGVSVSLTDTQGRSVSTRTNNFGRYSFTGVTAGELYIVSVASGKRYTFSVSSQAVNVQDAVENIDFTADSGAFRFDEMKP